ncbi:MAG: hypothetical protein IMF08_00495 [Proteobacteria bacterium]|nr:hypothetical protein [Pseudomonadota bacterium]
MRYPIFTACIAAACMLAIAPAPVAAGASQRLFEIPGHGLLGLEGMGYWEQQVDFLAADGFPRIHLYNDTGIFSADRGERIRITVTPAWRTPDTQRDFGTEQGIRRIVQQYADETAASLALDSLELVPVGRDKIGFWFLASDNGFFSKKLDDGFRHMRQGALVVGELVVTFIILSDDERYTEGDFAVLLMTHAEHLKGTCNGVTTSCYSYTNDLPRPVDPR